MSAPGSLTLWDIEAAVLGLSEIIESPDTTEEEKQAARGELERWVQAEVKKVDRVRGFLRHCAVMEEAAKFEALAMGARAKRWSERARLLKELCISAMQASGVKRLEGHSGVLRIQAVGGKLALKITREDLVPPQYKTYTYTFTHSELVWLCKHVNIPGSVKGPVTATDNDAIRKALETKCARCAGKGSVEGPMPGSVENDEIEWTCTECSGAGHQLVSGCELAERGVALRVE